MTVRRKVAVLMGGTSAERAVSLSTGRQILGALSAEQYAVTSLDTKDVPALLAALTENRPDVAVIAVHGKGGEDGTLQGLLELLGIPYTGSGVLASALALDKAMSKRALTAAGVRMPRGFSVRRGEQVAAGDAPMPCIVKPNTQGSTIGMTVVESPEGLAAALGTAFQHDDRALIEEFVTGVEITVPILGNETLEALPIVEIVPAKGFYDYEAKYTPGATDEIVPARLSEAAAAEARRIAVLCHQTLGCRGMSRTDMIIDPKGACYTLEINTVPGMTPTSLLPRSAEAAGYSFGQLLDRLIFLALE